MNRSSASIACSPEDPDVIVGYLVYEPKTIHYVYVKEAFRKLGICRRLLVEAGLFEGTIATHMTFKGRRILLQMGYIYAPYF